MTLLDEVRYMKIQGGHSNDGYEVKTEIRR